MVLNHLFFIGHEAGDPIANNALLESVPNHPFLGARMQHLHTFKTPAHLNGQR